MDEWAFVLIVALCIALVAYRIFSAVATRNARAIAHRITAGYLGGRIASPERSESLIS